ncbi:MAG TPA: LemA family protein [Candidatus Nanoarchaeia archaeon]|nr:LemA family protein [Candidatus Nanoarchaeia archaeon]
MAKNRKVSKWLWIGVPIAVVLLFVFWIGGTYNSLIRLDEAVGNAWGNVQTAYQRRADLIPSLVETVKAYTDYEGPLLKEITDARASVGRAGTPEQLSQAGAEMNSAVSRLLVTVENYPDLKANENFLDLQVQLEGTENRIKVERDNYNKAVQYLNVKVRRFPSNIIAGWFGFGQKTYFEADDGAEKRVDVGSLFK